MFGDHSGSGDTASIEEVGESEEASSSSSSAPGAPPCGRYGHAALFHRNGEEFVVIGGTDCATYFDDVRRYNRATKRWSQTPTIGAPTPRFGHTATPIPGEPDLVMVFGGSNNSYWSNDTYTLDLRTGQWTKLHCNISPMPRRGHTTVALGTDLILFGGQAQFSFQDVWLFDTVTSCWHELRFEEPALPGRARDEKPAARYCHTACVSDGRVVVWGGHGARGCVSDDVWVLEVEGDNGSNMSGWWGRLATVGEKPCPRFGHSATLIGRDRMVVLGGMDAFPNGKSYNDIHELDVAVGMWRCVEATGAVPRPRRLHSATADPSATGRLLVFGGWNGQESYKDMFEVALPSVSLKALLRRFIFLHSVPYR